MRPLTEHEIQAISGAETITYTLPAGSTVTTRLEANNSTTISVQIPGLPTYQWNSGIAVACYVTVAGFGMTAGISSGNPWVGALTGYLVDKGCKVIMSNYIPDYSSANDGD